MRTGTICISLGFPVPGTLQVLHECLLIDLRPHEGADKKKISPFIDISQPGRCPALKTQSLVSFPGRMSVQGAARLGGGHHSSGPNHVEGCGWRSLPSRCPQLPPSPSRLHLCAALILIGVGLEVAPSPGERSLLPPQAEGSLASPPTSQQERDPAVPQVQPYPDLPASPPAGVSSAIFFVPGFLLLVPGGARGPGGGQG